MEYPSTQGAYKGSTIKYKNYKNQGNQEKKRMIGFT